ncbi:MAG: hypothetical protein KDA81_05100 [Planctomycetaceae bacterium]|nr:hypothetical protein [Planctomycetaceae bacterium]
MNRKTLTTTCLMILTGVLMVPSLSAEDAPKVTEVKLKDLTLKVPETWKSVPSASSMRLATYSVPAAEGDKEEGELSVFNFGGGGGDVASNLSRWIGQFGGEGRSSKVTKGKAGANEYYLADISGTYNKPVGPPILRKTESAPGYRMLAAIVVLEEKGVYYLKLTGPDATIKAQADAFRASFGGDAKSETDYEL